MISASQAIEIGARKIGYNQPIFVIAEAGVNHNGNLELACRLVDVAAEAGADAVKFQTFRARDVASAVAPKAQYQVETTGAEESQREMLERLELSPNAHRTLIERCHERNIQFLSTPFDFESVDLLDRLDVSAFKIASGEITNWPLLQHIASKRRPVILSTGMSDLEEVDGAVRQLRLAGCANLAILHCTSSYPADPVYVNLRAMHTIAQSFQAPVGLSDHTIGMEVAIAAAALGACVLEKHFTLDRSLSGPDHRASLEPSELHSLVRSIRIVEAALGDGQKRAMPSELDVRNVARRSIVARHEIPAGTCIDLSLVAFKRPGTGIPPSDLTSILGRTAVRMIPADTLIQLEDLV